MSQTVFSTGEFKAERAQLIDLLLRKKGLVAPGAQSIPRRDRLKPCPLSHAQQRLWFLDRLEPGGSSYNLTANLRLEGWLDVAALGRALSEIERRHEALRTTFMEAEGQPVQVISPAAPLALPVTDLSGLPEAEREGRARELAIEEARRPFDLAAGPLFRRRLLRLSEEDHVLLVIMHHVVSDGWSLGVLLREVKALYAAYAQGAESPLPELPIQYADYASWQHSYLTGEVLDTQLDYWKQRLSGAPPLLELPTDRPRPAHQSYQGARLAFTLDAELTKRLKALAQAEGCTLFMLLLAGYAALLSRYSGQEDVVVGADIANRNRRETEGLIGFFINMLALRTDLSGNPTFRELLARVRDVSLGGFAHQDVPFDKVVGALRPERNAGHSPIFQVVFILQNAPMPAFELEGLTARPFGFDSGSVRFDLTLEMAEDGDHLRGFFVYRTDLFDADRVARMEAHFKTLLRSAVERPDARLDALEVQTAAEKQQLAARRRDLKQSNFKKFKAAAQKPTVSAAELVTAETPHEGRGLPLVVRPRLAEVDLALWAEGHREFVEQRLARHGALLFRGFGLKSLSDFDRFVRSFPGELLDYSEPSTPRTHITANIFSSTEYPAHLPILQHNELSYSHAWPMRLWFFAARPAARGGETPISDSREVFRLLDPKLRERFAEKKVMYVRNYGDGVGLPWQSVFGTKNREEVEAHCRRHGVRFEWRGGERLRTWQVRQAVAVHPRTGETVWFNQAHLHHVSSLPPEIRDSLLSVVEDGEYPLDINAFYGDGSPIEAEALAEIRRAYAAATVPVAWQAGDVLMLDNMLAAHGREPFEGPRSIAVAMAEPYAAAPGA